MNAFGLSYAVLWLLVIVQSVVLISLVHTVFRLHHDVELGSNGSQRRPAPSFTSVDVDGMLVRSLDWPKRLRALLFVSPSCTSCERVLGGLEPEALKQKAAGEIVVICRGSRDECRQLRDTHSLEIPVLADTTDEVTRLYAVKSVPTAVLIDADGNIQSTGEPELPPEFERTPVAERDGLAV